MTFEQNFTEEEIVRIEDVMVNIIKKTGNFDFLRKKWVRLCLFALAGVLIISCAVMYFMRGSFNGTMGLVTVGALFCIVWSVFLDFMKRKMDRTLAAAVRSRYQNPFTVVMEPNTMSYRGIEFDYAAITQSMEIDELLFMQVNGKWLVLKLEEDVKADFLAQLKGVS